jgi:hypothetical protein
LLVSQNQVLLALATGNDPIFILDALHLRLLRICRDGRDSTNRFILDMAFNPNSKVPALVAAFSNTRLSVFNYLTGELQWTDKSVSAKTLSCSPDGQFVVLGDFGGGIKIFKFEQTCQDGGIGLCPI